MKSNYLFGIRESINNYPVRYVSRVSTLPTIDSYDLHFEYTSFIVPAYPCGDLFSRKSLGKPKTVHIGYYARVKNKILLLLKKEYFEKVWRVSIY